MGYDLHITRAGTWTRGAEHPISREEWRSVADTWPGMRGDGDNPFGNTALDPCYALHADTPAPVYLDWEPGGIQLRPAHPVVEIARIAEALGARLLGDDNEEYLPDGGVVDHYDYPRPDLLVRPLFVNEVAAAWKSRISWEDAVDELSVAGQALRVFAEMAVREVAGSSRPDDDQLHFRYRTQTAFGREAFVLAMSRIFVRPDSAGGGAVRVECELQYHPRPELAALNTVHKWQASADIGERRAWLAELAARPEWAVVDRLVPRRLIVAGQPAWSSRMAGARR